MRFFELVHRKGPRLVRVSKIDGRSTIHFGTLLDVVEHDPTISLCLTVLSACGCWRW